MNEIQNRPWHKHWPAGVPKHIDYPEVPLPRLLSIIASKFPEKVAITSGEKQITYAELDRATDKLAAYLSEHGLKKGDCTALYLPNSLEFVIGYYSILKAGGTIASVNPLCREEELRYQVNDSGAIAIITDLEHYPVVEQIKERTSLATVVIADAVDIGAADSLPEILQRERVSPPDYRTVPKQDPAAIQYTGGTTGFPKGVVLTHYNLVANAIQNAVWFKWSEKDVVIGALAFSHSWGASACINSPIYAGARMVVIRRFSDETLLKTIQQEKATVLYGATSMFIMLLNSPLINKYDISSLRYVKSGAMPIPPEIQSRWEQTTGVKMVSGYGLSEASPETHNCPLERVKTGTIGMPVSDTDAHIVDEATGTKELPPGQVGELIIRGPQVMQGYLHRPEDTKEALRDGWLFTGDLATMDEEGYFRIVDRKKETIKFKGYTIAPAEVEAVLYEHEAVKECAVIGKPNDLAGEIPKAFIVLKDGCHATPEELIKFCEVRLAPYKRIREVEFIDSIPKTPVGKVLRRILRDRER
ncbi:MAG: long-chain fatty acid--CoA ligase [Chloroflexi bacterium]|nr:long-chain fatty acid--CoA ligase [Chloroflexota bacterium]